MNKIMFNDKFLLTQAVLEGRKTQTRRIVPQKELGKISLFQKEYYDVTFDKLEGVELLKHYFLTEKYGKFPYNVGEVVAVAQSYRDCGGINEYGVPMWEIISKRVGGTNAGWDNKMFVKPELMPHQIRITDVRVEKLQEISDEDCLKEGIYEDGGDDDFIPHYFYNYENSGYGGFDLPQMAYADLINRISGKRTWESNHYVFVYDFELVK